MGTVVAWVAVIAVLAAANLWVHLGHRRTQELGGALTAAALIGVGLAAGLSAATMGLSAQSVPLGFGYGAAGAAVVAGGYGAALATRRSHRFFRDRRYRLGRSAALRVAFVVVPLATVLPEEVAFRGVLWGLVERDGGVAAAVVVTSVLFGLWHVLPALQLTRTSTALAAEGGDRIGRARRTTVGVAVVIGTTVAGLVLAELRRRSGSLVAPVMLHLATNAFGVLASAWVWSITAPAAPRETSHAPERQPRPRRAARD